MRVVRKITFEGEKEALVRQCYDASVANGWR